MFYFLIGLIAGVALALLFGGMKSGSAELDVLRNENTSLREANQGLSTSLKQAQDHTYNLRPLAQPAKPFGGRSSRSSKDSE